MLGTQRVMPTSGSSGMDAVVGAAFPGQAAAAVFTGPSRLQVEEIRRGSRLPA
jgi:hypothetical protein